MALITEQPARRPVQMTSRPGQVARASSRFWIAAIFIFCLIIPLSFNLGPVRLSIYRIWLLVVLIPALVQWATGRAGPVRGFDICILLAYLWGAVALFVVHPFDQILQTSGVLFLEGFGSYLVARAFITSREDYERLMKVLLWVIAFLLPFAFVEALTGYPILLGIFNKIGHSYAIITQEKRFGLERAQVVFDHSIPYGAFASAGFGAAFFLTTRPGRKFWALGTVVASTVFSVSTGALLALVLQMGLTFWERCTRWLPRRWLVIGLLFLAAYFAIDLLSNRTPIYVFVDYMTFSSQSSYNRILIFTYGMQNIWAHPYFGIGLGDWVRPEWMGDSVDNFWLLTAMRYGIPSFLLLAAGIIWLLFSVGYRRLARPENIRARYAFVFPMIGMIVAGITVAYWNALFAFFMFFVGTGVWITHCDDRAEEPAATEAPPAPLPLSRFTRQTEWKTRKGSPPLAPPRRR